MKPSDKDNNKIRLQTFLSRNGICSRRKAMEIIQAKRVSVNNQVIDEPSYAVESGADNIKVDGKPVAVKGFDYVMLHKPKGCVTTKKDPFAKETVYDFLPKALHHLAPVGRLDKDTEGLLLLSNDGEFVNRLTHPRYHQPKTYFVRTAGIISEAKIKQLEEGILLEEKMTLPCRISRVRILKGVTELEVVITEGRKRQIRKMFEFIGGRVIYLKRVAQGPVMLGELKKGGFRKLTQKEIQSLK